MGDRKRRDERANSFYAKGTIARIHIYTHIRDFIPPEFILYVQYILYLYVCVCAAYNHVKVLFVFNNRDFILNGFFIPLYFKLISRLDNRSIEDT